eukprot:6074773-Prymnesium_polylepis.1
MLALTEDAHCWRAFARGRQPQRCSVPPKQRRPTLEAQLESADGPAGPIGDVTTRPPRCVRHDGRRFA